MDCAVVGCGCVRVKANGKTHQQTTTPPPNSIYIDVLYRIKTEIYKPTESGARHNEKKEYYHPSLDDLVDIDNVFDILPSTHEEFKFAAKHGTAKLHLNNRDVEWIQDNGMSILFAFFF